MFPRESRKRHLTLEILLITQQSRTPISFEYSHSSQPRINSGHIADHYTSPQQKYAHIFAPDIMEHCVPVPNPSNNNHSEYYITILILAKRK